MFFPPLLSLIIISSAPHALVSSLPITVIHFFFGLILLLTSLTSPIFRRFLRYFFFQHALTVSIYSLSLKLPLKRSFLTLSLLVTPRIRLELSFSERPILFPLFFFLLITQHSDRSFFITRHSCRLSPLHQATTHNPASYVLHNLPNSLTLNT